MFGFNDQKLTSQEITRIADQQGIAPIRVAIQRNGYKSSSGFWEPVKDIAGASDKYPVISLGNDCDVVGRLSRSVANSVQFPESSAYMHFIGCVSSVMVNRFWIDYHGSYQPTGLYIVTSQPPSTGKSAINTMALAPMIVGVQDINAKRQKERKTVLAKLAHLKNELKNEHSKTEVAALMDEKDALEDKLTELCDVIFPVSDTTPEGLARINNRQGDFAVISDEATSINSLLGMTYANSERKTNSELILKAWDGGAISIARANIDNNMSFRALGAISVIAQDETITGIMDAGARGIGVSERFLLVREESFLGRRRFIDDNGESVYQEVDRALVAEYHHLVHNIMKETDIKLKFSKSAMKYLNKMRQELEPHLADGGKYSHTMLRGAIGKMDKQVTRLAAVLHVVRNWSRENFTRSTDVQLDTVQEAVLMFDELCKTYINAANASGHAGDEAEMTKMIDVISRVAKSSGRGIVSVRAAYEAARKVRPFLGQSSVMRRITENILPALEEKNYICVIDNLIYVNPVLFG